MPPETRKLGTLDVESTEPPKFQKLQCGGCGRRWDESPELGCVVELGWVYCPKCGRNLVVRP